jgi:hypothetical protein
LYSTQYWVKVVRIIIAHAALMHVLDVFLIVREVVGIQPVLEICPKSFNDPDVLNPRLLR